MHATAARLRPSEDRDASADHARRMPGPSAVRVVLVTQLRPLIRLAVPLAGLPQVAGLERWLATYVVGPLTGAHDESQ